MCGECVFVDDCSFELRKWEKRDVESVARFANNKKIADNLRNAFPHPYVRKDAEHFIDACISNGDNGRCCRAIAVDGEAVGSISVFMKDDVYCKSAEMGYWLAEPFWGRGIMTEAIRRICELAFKQMDIVRIFAEPYAYNQGSCRALEKAGFELEGVLKKSVYKNGEIIDSCMYALVK
jgi:[ribosomal protein S5]-alanine N-acetyltransferase